MATLKKAEALGPVVVVIDTTELTGNKYVITEGVTKDSVFEVQVKGSSCMLKYVNVEDLCLKPILSSGNGISN